jgi:hypothetical protein
MDLDKMGRFIDRHKNSVLFKLNSKKRHIIDAVSKALDIRKNGERPFNLLKKRKRLEQVRVRSHYGVVVRTTFTKQLPCYWN